MVCTGEHIDKLTKNRNQANSRNKDNWGKFSNQLPEGSSLIYFAPEPKTQNFKTQNKGLLHQVYDILEV